MKLFVHPGSQEITGEVTWSMSGDWIANGTARWNGKAWAITRCETGGRSIEVAALSESEERAITEHCEQRRVEMRSQCLAWSAAYQWQAEGFR